MPLNFRVRFALLGIIAIVALGACAKKTAAEFLEAAKAQEAKGNLAAATIELKSGLQVEPNNGAIRFMLGRLSNALFDSPTAESELLKARKLGVMEGGRLAVELARALRYQGKFTELLVLARPEESFEKPHLATVHALRGRAYFALGMDDDAGHSLELASALDSQSPDVMVLAAVLKAGQLDFDGALRLISKALTLDPRHFDARQYKAELLRAQGQIDDAVVAYGDVLQLNGLDFRALAGRAALLLGQKKLDAAEKDIETLNKAYPNNPRALSLRGFLQLAQLNLKAALESAQLALKNDPTYSAAKLIAGLANRGLGANAQAEEYLSKFLAANPASLNAGKALADLLLENNEPARALAVLRPILEGEQEDPRVFALAGDASMRVGDTESAMMWFDKAVSVGPKNAQVNIMRALAKMSLGESEGGLEELGSAVALSEHATSTDEMLILAYLSRNEIDRATKALESLNKRAPDSPITLNLEGLVLLAKADQGGATKAFENALQHAPGFYPAALNLAQLDIAAGQTDKAKERFEGVLAADDTNLLAMQALADIEVKTGKLDAAITLLERAVKSSPKSLATRLALISLYDAAGQKEKTRAMVEEALSANPDDPTVIALAAEVQLARGSADQAVATYSELLRISPNSDDIAVKVAEFQTKAGMEQQAEATLRGAIAKKRSSTAQIGLVSFLVAQDRIEDATTFARQVQIDQPKAPLGYVLEGEILEARKKYVEAAAAYEMALNNQPVGVFAVKRYFARRRSGDVDGALVELQKWSEQYPGDSTARAEIGNDLLANGHYKAAAESYEAVLKNAKAVSLSVLNNLALAYHAVKDKRGRDLATTSYRAKPSSATLADTLGWILVEDGEIQQGLEHIKRALTLAPQNQDIGYHLAFALAKSGDKATARATLSKLLESKSTFDTRKDAEELLRELN